MITRQRFACFVYAVLIVASAALSLGAPRAAADLSHTRIIRLSLVEGDVRFTRDVHGDPLTDSKNLWETAVLNLPIREGYVLATDHGRAAVEFENGTMAFLNENTVVEFYDLSLENGARTTRLILRQGGASFYVSRGNGDYFSVTGGDFTAETTAQATFRLDNFDDGSNLNVTAGRVVVVRKEHTTSVNKGESFAINATTGKVNVLSLPRTDDFDRWVSARVESAVAATSAGLQYGSNFSDYTSGFGDLYTYGSWYPVGAYGYGWQPFGAGLGWSPFGGGGWFTDSAFGWGFIGNQPWGWLPYHYGGWLFQPGLGWVWLPGNFGRAGSTAWRPATVSWVHLNTGAVGIVPAHPLDVPGKTSANLVHGVFPVSNGVVSGEAVENSAEWKTTKAPARNVLTNSLSASTRPELVSRTILSGGTGNRIVTIGHDSGIAYDAREHRFVNASAISRDRTVDAGTSTEVQRSSEVEKVTTSAANPASRNPAVQDASAARRENTLSPRRPLTPAPSPAERSAGGVNWGEANSGPSSGGRASAPAPAASSSPRASSGASGGRPH